MGTEVPAWTRPLAASSASFSGEGSSEAGSMGTEVPAWTMPSAFTGEGWYDEEQVREFQASYQAKSGDMFCVSDMPLDRCISRAIMAMAEEISCWDDSYRNKPFVYRAQASVLGAQACLMKVNAMPGRRRALAGWGAPKDLPCRLPLPTGIGTPPKVCVLFSDPRHMLAVIFGYAMRRFNLPLSLAEFIHLFVTKKLDKLDIFRYFHNVLAWARFAQQFPAQVRMVCIKDLWSGVPKVAQRGLEAFAGFFEVQAAGAERLAVELFDSAERARQAMAKDDHWLPQSAGTPPDGLLQWFSSHVFAFEEALASLPAEDSRLRQQCCAVWSNCDVAELPYPAGFKHPMFWALSQI